MRNTLDFRLAVQKLTITNNSITDEIFPRALFTLGNKYFLQSQRRAVGYMLRKAISFFKGKLPSLIKNKLVRK